MKKILSLLTDKKMRLAALLVVTVFSFAVSGTLCYFMMSTLSIENNFVPARLNVVIHETFTDQGEAGYVKENVTVENAVLSPDEQRSLRAAFEDISFRWPVTAGMFCIFPGRNPCSRSRCARRESESLTII